MYLPKYYYLIFFITHLLINTTPTTNTAKDVIATT